ncbi:MAG: lamin tail domain-containing protein, partial [Caldilineales bacterium]|nr:lamin tail domain-containing protein [Caldilineales bacterium]
MAWSRYPDGSGIWHTDSQASPGNPNPAPPPPTATPSPTPTATSIPTGVLLNEYLPAPSTGNSEYVELFNANAYDIDLTDWQIDDSEGGSSPYTIPAGTNIAAGGFLLVERSFGFNNDGDAVRLFTPDGDLRDSHSYVAAASGIPWSRAGDGAAAWTNKYPRTPGQSNRPAVLTLSGHLYQGAPPDVSQGIGGHYIGLYGGDDSNNPTQWLANAPTQFDGAYSLTYDTAQALYRYYTLRPAPLPGYEYTAAASLHGIVPSRDRIRFGGLPGGSYSGNDFWMSAQPTATPTATPLPDHFVVINEILPAPREVDFDGSGEASAEDEYIELFNSLDRDVDLGGWLLDDAPDGSRSFRLPPGTTITARGFLLFFRADTGIALNNDGDSVRLLTPDGGIEADRFDYDSARSDIPWSRSVDGAGEWVESYPASPGGPNLPPSPTMTPTPSPFPTPPPPGFTTTKECTPRPREPDPNGNREANPEHESNQMDKPRHAPTTPVA